MPAHRTRNAPADHAYGTRSTPARKRVRRDSAFNAELDAYEPLSTPTRSSKKAKVTQPKPTIPPTPGSTPRSRCFQPPSEAMVKHESDDESDSMHLSTSLVQTPRSQRRSRAPADDVPSSTTPIRPRTSTQVSAKRARSESEVEAELLPPRPSSPTPIASTSCDTPLPSTSPPTMAAEELEQERELPARGRLFETKLVLQLLRRVSDTLQGRAQPYLPSDSTAEPVSAQAVADMPALPTTEIWERDVRAQLDRTIREGEGNCMLLVGARSVGKTAIVERSLRVLADAYGGDAFVVVRLNGMVCTTDRSTLREIARQLCTDAGAIDDDGSSFTSHATVLSSLLSILQPPQPSETTARPIVFVLDEFDLFAQRDARQSFLYCLLDIVQSRKRSSGGMTVLGLSARSDCVNLLEKRVKSRCQSRILHMLPPTKIEDFVGVGKTAMRCDPTLLGDDGAVLARYWNAAVDEFFARAATQREVKAIHQLLASKADLLARLGMLVARTLASIDSSRSAIELPALASSSFVPLKVDATRSVARASLVGLSIPQLAVLIAAKNLQARAKEHDRPFFNLAMTYDDYYQALRRYNQNKVNKLPEISRDVFVRAYERLCSLELIVDAAAAAATSTGNSRGASTSQALNATFRKCRLVPSTVQVEDAVKHTPCVTEMMRQWCAHSEIA